MSNLIIFIIPAFCVIVFLLIINVIHTIREINFLKVLIDKEEKEESGIEKSPLLNKIALHNAICEALNSAKERKNDFEIKVYEDLLHDLRGKI